MNCAVSAPTIARSVFAYFDAIFGKLLFCAMAFRRVFIAFVGKIDSTTFCYMPSFVKCHLFLNFLPAYLPTGGRKLQQNRFVAHAIVKPHALACLIVKRKSNRDAIGVECRLNSRETRLYAAAQGRAADCPGRVIIAQPVDLTHAM